MKIDKVANQYDTYRLELSYSQLLAVRDALNVHHADPVADEMLKGLSWYLDELPRPGEEKGSEEEGATLANPIVNQNGDIDLDSTLPAPDDGAPEDVDVAPVAVNADVDVDAELPAPEEDEG